MMNNQEKNEFLFEKNKQVKYFNKIGVKEFAVWIKNFLCFGWRGNIVLNVGKIERDEFLTEYFYSIDDARFRSNFREAVLRLLLEWNSSHDRISLLIKLLNIIGWTKNIDCFHTLLNMALNEEVKESQSVSTVDLHERLLAVLFSLKIDHEGVKSLIERDIKDCRYTQLCFRRSWEMTGDIMSSVKYLPDLIRSGREVPLTHFTFLRFIKRIGVPNFVNDFESILEGLHSEDRNDLFKYLAKIGVEWSQSGKTLIFYFPWDRSKDWRVEIEEESLIFEIADQEGTIPVGMIENRTTNQIEIILSSSKAVDK